MGSLYTPTSSEVKPDTTQRVHGQISAHPDFERLTAEQLRTAIGDLGEDIKLAVEMGDKEIETWKVQERRLAQAELARRNGNAQPVDGSSSARSPITIRISDVAREEVTWLWKDRIPIGKLTLVEGDPGLGKSWLCLAIAAAVSRGFALSGDSPREPVDVLLMTAEDGLGDTVRPRLEDMGADLSRIAALRCFKDAEGKEQAPTLADLDIIEAAIERHKPRLVIVDPIIAFVAGADTHKANEVRGLLSPLASLAEKHGAAIVAVRHLNKSAARAFYRGQGSIDFVAACRSAFVVGEDPDDPAVRIFCHLKSNLAPKTPSLAFSIDQGVFGWKGESPLTADQVLAVPGTEEKRTEQDEARDFLRTLLGSGPMPSPEIIKQAAKAGFSERTVWRAKKSLNIRANRKGFGRGGEWIWSLDGGADDHTPPHTPPKAATVSEVADMAAYGESGSLCEVAHDAGGHLRGEGGGSWEDIGTAGGKDRHGKN